MHCEMCGKECEASPVLIEGTEMQVCPDCARHGKPLKKPDLTRKIKPVKEEPEKMIVRDYSSLVKKKREELGLKQEEFAKLLNEKVSTIQSIESGNLKPTLKLAEKIKKQYGLNLIEEFSKTVEFSKGKSKDTSFTIEDFMKK